MASSLSNFDSNLSEQIQEIKCKYKHIDKKCETYAINKNLTDDLKQYKYYVVIKIINKCLKKS